MLRKAMGMSQAEIREMEGYLRRLSFEADRARTERELDAHCVLAEAAGGTAWMPAPLSMPIATIGIEDGTARAEPHPVHTASPSSGYTGRTTRSYLNSA